MITVGQLKLLLDKIPNDFQVSAYEGEGIGLRIEDVHDAIHLWISACDNDVEESQHEFFEDLLIHGL